MDVERGLLRHIVATIAYRGGKALRDAPADFGGFRAGTSSRTAVEILAHVGDLFEWALTCAKGSEVWHESRPQSWPLEVDRFFGTLAVFDAFLASEAPFACPAERLVQGPIADALTHIGQLAMLRRLAGSPVRGENYSRADIVAGRVGPQQSPPRREFD
jgi:hypothetical protein